MARIAILGGHGQIARHLHPVLVQLGHTPVALVRDPGYADELGLLGAETRVLDLEQADVAEYAAALADCDAVVFAAGGGADGNVERKRTVDLGASLKAQEAAGRAGARRFVQISAIGVDQPLGEDVEPVWRAYVEAKRDADAALRDSNLAWTILRPGRLTDDAPTGRVELGPEVERGEVTRGDVAQVVAAVLDDDATVGRQLEVIGGRTAIADALRALASGG